MATAGREQELLGVPGGQDARTPGYRTQDR